MHLLTQRYRAFCLAFASGICFNLAFPPIGLSGIGWLAPLGMLHLIATTAPGEPLAKRQIWLACFLNWLVLFQCVRLPHWAGYIGWPLLSAYLCSFLFLFPLVTRHFVARFRIPLLIAAPVAWVGLEYIQAHFLTGISLGLLCHTQAWNPILIQVADLAGCYTVSFLMVGAITAIYVLARGVIERFGKHAKTSAIENESKTGPDERLRLSNPITGLVQFLFIATFLFGYGYYRLQKTDRALTTHDFSIALIQGSIDTQFPASVDEARAYFQLIDDHYSELSIRSRKQPVDLIVWPESMFPMVDLFDPTNSAPADDQEMLSQYQNNLMLKAKIVSGAIAKPTVSRPELRQLHTAVPMLVGGNSVGLDRPNSSYNSALLIDSDGVVKSRYGKMKLVLFGEYVPLGDVFPWFYQFFPMGSGLRSGKQPVAMKAGEFRFAPNICFESTYPHLIRNHVIQLAKRGEKPDCLVNLTNDGWFWGSNALDFHLANTVFRTVENRTPALIAANTGISGLVDPAGRIVVRGPRRNSAVLTVNLVTSKQFAPYHLVGDWPVFLCFLVVLGCFLDWSRSIRFRSN